MGCKPASQADREGFSESLCRCDLSRTGPAQRAPPMSVPDIRWSHKPDQIQTAWVKAANGSHFNLELKRCTRWPLGRNENYTDLDLFQTEDGRWIMAESHHFPQMEETLHGRCGELVFVGCCWYEIPLAKAARLLQRAGYSRAESHFEPRINLDLVLDQACRDVRRDGFPPVRLTRRLWNILEVLLKNRGEFTDEPAIRKAWSGDEDGGRESSTIRDAISELRMKLKPLGVSIKNERAFGWKLVDG